MSPAAEQIWRELYTHAGPSSAIPILEPDFFESIETNASLVDSALVELQEIGALAALTAKELSLLASRKRLEGNFVIARRADAHPTHIRVTDPADLNQSIIAQIEALHRELAKYADRVHLPQPVSAHPANVHEMIAALETGLCHYQMANGWVLESTRIDGEVRLQISVGEWARRPSVLQQSGGAHQAVEGRDYVLLPIDEVGTETLRRLVSKTEMEFVIPADLKAIDDYCNNLEASLARLSVFVLPAWATAPAAESSRRERIPDDVRREVWRRDCGRCVECGNNENIEFDHIIPWAKGGSSTARNIQLLCESCNRKKSDRI